jgi:hypothetical protein
VNYLFKPAIVLLMSGALLAAGSLGNEAHYVGPKKCKICHDRKDNTSQYQVWQSSGHAKAFATLATDKAMELAAKAGIKGNPQQAKECLECHVTGYGLDSSLFEESYIREEGVQCESCHGPGSKYKLASIMSTSKYISQRDTQHQMALDAGLVIPDEKTCIKCHNSHSPAYKGFDYKTYYEKIKHQYVR